MIKWRLHTKSRQMTGLRCARNDVTRGGMVVSIAELFTLLGGRFLGNAVTRCSLEDMQYDDMSQIWACSKQQKSAHYFDKLKSCRKSLIFAQQMSMSPFQ